ncbi:LOW QUALITY PROTEIN: sex hormone-binding globulin [Choloepus didactylus]|uniref:LOW QUALITY PROTEIN: sex hormone-binding globulin n=1 Tax=Choloepus didactylus TaxID=27675 RepID=UPI0018A0418F|nr:LOW QUALITY PROTEIN: sex hormone-binding globulin [Choloepus didactylus]
MQAHSDLDEDRCSAMGEGLAQGHGARYLGSRPVSALALLEDATWRARQNCFRPPGRWRQPPQAAEGSEALDLSEPQRGIKLTMETRGPLAVSQPLLLLLLLLLPPHTHEGLALGRFPPTQRPQDPPELHLINGTGQEPVTIMTFDINKIMKISSSFELRTWDPEGVIFYGDTNRKDDWFVLALRDGRLEIQMHNPWAQLTVGAGPRLDDGTWHQVEVKSLGDSLLLRVDGEEVLCLRQVSGMLANKPQPIMRIAVGGLLSPPPNLRLPLVPALDGCLCQGIWLDPWAQTSVSTRTGFRGCAAESHPGIFFPPGTCAEFSLQDIPQPQAEPWAFSLDLGFQVAAGTGHLLTLGTPENPSWLSLYLQDQKVVLSSGPGPGLDLPLVLGPPLQLKLDMSRVVLSQGSTNQVLAMPPEDPVPLLNLWAQPQGRLFLGALPGEASSASFCLDGLWAQGQKLDMDGALSRSQDIWTHSCPQSLGNGTDTSH